MAKQFNKVTINKVILQNRKINRLQLIIKAMYDDRDKLKYASKAYWEKANQIRSYESLMEKELQTNNKLIQKSLTEYYS